MSLFKKNWRLLLFIATFIIGIILLQNCVKYGEQYVQIFMYGGGMDTNKYLLYLGKSIDKYKTMGIILSILGGVGVIIDIFKVDFKNLTS